MRHYTGIDLDQFNIKAGVVDENGVLIWKESIKTRADRDRKANEIVRDIAYLTQNVIAASKIPRDEIHAMGIGSPGMVNNDTGILMQPANLPLHNVNIRNDIRKIVPLPVYIENNSNCTALAESLTGAAKGMNHSVTMTIGADIKGGVIVNRRIYNGFNHAASDLGHFVIELDGEKPCRCGKNGCFASYASTMALLQDTVKTAKQNPNSLLNELIRKNIEKAGIEMLFDAMKKGDKTAKSVVDRYIHRLSIGLDSISCILMPEVIVLDGEICKEGDFILSLINEEIGNFKPCLPGGKRTRIKMSEAGDDAGIIGAAMMAKIYQMDGIRGDGSQQGTFRID